MLIVAPVPVLARRATVRVTDSAVRVRVCVLCVCSFVNSTRCIVSILWSSFVGVGWGGVRVARVLGNWQLATRPQTAETRQAMCCVLRFSRLSSRPPIASELWRAQAWAWAGVG